MTSKSNIIRSFCYSALLASFSAVPAESGCPSECTCLLADNRKTFMCSNGGRTKIPITEIDPSTHTIIIIAPEDYENNITIGRIFLKFHNLEILKITHSNIPAIGDSTFWPGRRLKVLDLSHNVIRFLRASDFNGLKNLKELDLSNNRLSATPSAPFRYLINLSRLLLAKNELNTLVPRFFYPLQKLTDLDLSGNALHVIDPDNLQDVRGLKLLNLASCHLTQIHPLLYQRLPLLETLNLQNNSISSIAPEEYRHLKFLQYLKLDGNLIMHIPDRAFSDHNFRTLQLSENNIKTISRCAFCNSRIFYVNISSNKISTIEEDTFEPLSSSAEILDISGNNLSTDSFVAAIRPLKSLKIVQATNLALKEFPSDAFSGNLALVMMNFSYNEIEEIPEEISSLPKLEVIDFSHNKLSSVKEKTLHKISVSESLKTIMLHGNPYYCSNCEIEPLIMWINSSSFYNYSCHRETGDCVLCHYPRNMAGRMLHTVTLEEFQHCAIGLGALRSLEFASKTGLYVAVSIIIVIAIIIIFTIYVYRSHIAHYYTNEDRRIPCKVNE